ncbi:hypothetical protein L9F63_023739, partial [Diploptera punctata]
MAGGEGSGVTTGQPNLYKQDLAKLDVTKLTALSPEVISRQATINIGTIGHVAHGKSTVVKAISGVQTVRFKNELERNITIKLGGLETEPLEKSKTSGTVKSKNKRKPKLSISTKRKSSVGTKKPKLEETSQIESENEDGEPVYEVERILDHRKVGNNEILYLVKWKGWSKDSSTWEPEENLTNCGHCLKNYKSKVMGLTTKPNEVGFPSSEDIENLKLTLVQPTKAILENLMKTFSGRGFVKYTVPKEKDINKKLIELLKVPESKRDPSLVQKVKHELTVRAFHFKRLEQLQNLREWEMEMNFISADEARIFVENEVDFEIAPPNFIYVNDYLPGEGVTIPEDPPIGCNCRPLCSASSGNCCGEQSGSTFPYGPDKRLIVPVGTPIYECNKRCKCGPECDNRVVQKGRMVNLCIFRTPSGCGWGVKSLQTIKKGSFVCEYVGEVIHNDEAEKRGMKYDAEGRTYLFDLDYNDKEQNPFTVDAAVYGNISHFINHSCEPNLAVYAVWINCLEPNLPKLALFATRNIKDGEEITFDYMCQSLKGNNSSSKESRLISESAFSPVTSPSTDVLVSKTQCKCGYANAKIYKCDNEKCPRPACYISGGSSKDDSFPCLRPSCSGRFQLVRHVSFVDCPGHDILMATMLNGAAVMDAALLLIAGNESCPQPQTSEHLAAIEIMKLKHILILQNKIDLVKEGQAKEQYEQILKFVQGTVAEGAPVVPISAQLKYNIEVLCEYITKKIPVPMRDFTSLPRLIVIRSFDVNKPGCEVDDLKGGVAGGSILRGVLKVGMEIEVRPGLVSKDSEGKLTCRPIFSRIVSLFAEQNELQFAVPGGLIGISLRFENIIHRTSM